MSHVSMAVHSHLEKPAAASRLHLHMNSEPIWSQRAACETLLEVLFGQNYCIRVARDKARALNDVQAAARIGPGF